MSQGNVQPGDEPVGKLDPGPRDSSLQPRGTENEEPLDLPEGAIVALRKSGGLRFSTRTLIIFANGEAHYMASGGSGLAARSSALELTETQLLRLRRMLAHVDFAAVSKGPGRVSPDAFVYEITARALGQTHSLEAWDGAIPAAIKPLVDLLQRLMPNT